MTVAFALFRAQWMLAILFHQASYGATFRGPGNTALSLSALLALAAPTRGSLFVLACLLQLAEVAHSLPRISNHWVLMAFGGAVVLVAWLHEAWDARRASVDVGAWYRRALPALRWLALGLYFFAVFHKLNTGYLSPAGSCAAVHLRAFTNAALEPEGSALALLAIYGSLVAETLIGASLILPRTRPLGIVVGVVFHLILALNPVDVFYNFSAVVYALYLTFVDPGALEALSSRARRLGPLAPVLGLAIVVTGVFPAARVGPMRFVFAAYAVALLGLLIALGRAGGSTTPAPVDLNPRGWALVTVVVLLLVNGASPYLGLKTETSFAMFSNLRTERGTTNHLLVRAPLPLGLQEDVVRILASNDPGLARRAGTDTGLTFFELQRYASARPHVGFVFERDGARTLVARAGDHPAFNQPPSWLLRKLLLFRPVDLRPNARCVH